MRNDEKEPQGPQQPQPYSGWSYDQDQPPPGPPVGPPPGYYPTNNPYNTPSGYLPDQGDNPDAYNLDDMTMDFGTSLGTGQTMGFHVLNMPQPSQPIPQLRQERLQQLREDRMRRQQRRINSDTTTVRPRKSQPSLPENMLSSSPVAPVGPGSVVPGAPAGQFIAPPFSPLPGVPSQQGNIPGGRSNSATLSPSAQLQSSVAPAQDTGIIQRVRVERATSLITIAFVASSILGLLETFLFTYVFGSGDFSNAYFQAYIVPNLIYTVVSGGALSSAFIPVFTSYALGRKDEKTAWHIASSALNLSVVFMIILAAIVMIFAPVLVPIYNPRVNPAEMSLIVTLTRIMLLQAIVLGSGVIVSAVLNTKQNFTLTAIGTVLYNIGLILGLMPGFFQTFHGRLSQPSDVSLYFATLGVVLGAVLQVGVQLPGLSKAHMRYTFAFDWRHPGVRQIVRQMGPRVFNSLMLSFSTVVDRILLSILASYLIVQSGLITDYFQAFSILVLPVSIFASSAATAAFPTMSNYVARNRIDRVREIIMDNLRSILFMTIPSAIGLIVLALPITQVLLEHGLFKLQDAQYTSVPLTLFAIGLPALAAIEILVRSFYVFQDSRTPVVISVAQFVLKIALSIVLLSFASSAVWGMGALAFSTAVASILEAVVLFFLLYRRIDGLDIRGLVNFLGRCAVAVGVMALVLLLARTVLNHIIDTTTQSRLDVPGILGAIVKLLLELGIGTAVFLIAARLLKMNELNYGMVRRVINRLRIPWL